MLAAGINPAFSEFQFHKGTIKPKFFAHLIKRS